MEDGEYCAKKARVEVKPDDEGEEEVMQDGGDAGAGGRAVVPAGLAMAPGPQIYVRLDVSLLHCQSCLLPLKPPIFKCEAAAGHIVCCHCRAGHGEVCSRANAHCGELDAVVGAARVPCPYRGFGCESYVAYHEATEHHRACPFAPCSCPDPGCAFVGSRAMLLDHFAADHARAAMAVRYGRSWNLSLPLSKRWHVLIGEDDDRSVFLVSMAALGAAATAVSLVCVRADGSANAVAAPQFWCKLSVELPGEDKDKLILMASTVGGSALSSGLPAPGQGMFLAVPQELLSGDMLALSVRIDLLRPAAKSTTPQARTGRRGRFND